ncbi:MAG: sensor histidine kinase [Mucilaginibacter sp.]
MQKKSIKKALKYIWIIPVLLLANLSKAQDAGNDSLAAATLFSQAKSLFLSDRTTALSKSLAGLEIAEKINNKTLQGNFNNVIGLIYTYQSKYDVAAKYFAKAKEFAIQVKDKLLLSKVYNNLGLNYMQEGKQLEAIQQSFNAIKVLEELGNTAGLGDTYANISNSYIRLNLYGKALAYADSALKYFKRINKLSGMANIYNNYGFIYSDTKQIPKALDYFAKSLKIKEQMNDQDGQANTLVNIGTAYYDLKDYSKAKELFKKAEVLFKLANDPKGIAEVQTNMANLKTATKDSTALNDSKKTYEYAKKNTTNEQQRDIALVVSRNYRNIKDYENSLKYYRIYDSLKDVTINESMLKQIATLEATYQNEKKQQQIKLLSKQNTIQQLQINKKNLTIYIIAIAFLLSAVIVYQVYSRNKIKQATKLQAAIIHQQNLAAKGIVEAEERERKRIAGDLHDGVGQLFSAVKLNLGVLVDKYVVKQDAAAVLSEKTMAMVDESCAEVRSIAHQMMPNALIKSGLVSALRDFINKIQSDKLKIQIQTQGIDKPLDSNVETVLYRVIQESVNNVIKHAQASVLDIFLLCDDKEITVTIEDNGKGFDMASRKDFTGIGLKNMISRVEFLKGSVEVSSSPGKGTLVAIYVPLT